MTNEMFLYGEKSYPVIEKDGKIFADFGEKGLKLLKRNESGELVKGFPGREPGSSNGAASSNANGKEPVTLSGLWAKIHALAVKQFSVPAENVKIFVTNKTVTVDIGIETASPFGTFYQPICTWSANLQDWLLGNNGEMSPSPTVQSADGLAIIAGFSTMLNNWHK